MAEKEVQKAKVGQPSLVVYEDYYGEFYNGRFITQDYSQMINSGGSQPLWSSPLLHLYYMAKVVTWF